MGDTLQEGDVSVALASQENPTTMWHRRHVRMSERGLKVLVEHDLLLGLKSENDNTSKDVTTVHINGKSVEDDSFEVEPEHEVQEPEEPDGVKVRRSTHQKGKPNWQSDCVMVIAQVVGAASRFMADPGQEHWDVVKKILKYIKGTPDVALSFRGLEFGVRGYIDSDYAGDL
ncbi:hypothetical protein KIW84_063446 [Lathyrus oleraceus]|uniref:Uncharacterized protein n=1 Tax=Pisum sativum TaxID=3888 RepID=A0A9D4W7P8_PEA|nr:hypothetical protein KIW84_063446 [Pisum sativum]